jgi:release factor glutamine methyltransferase
MRTAVDQSVERLVERVQARLSALPNARAEALELVAALLDVPKHWPLLHANKWVEQPVWDAALASARRRASGAPLAYAVGHANFRNLTLEVDERVLIPRPETELLIDLVLNRRSMGTAIDVGTGSGAIAIALATEGAFNRVIATDVSTDALDLARANASRYAGNIDFLQGDLLRTSGVGRLTSGVDVIVSNPPYISYAEIAELPASVRNWEPMVALLSGHDGLGITARLVRQAADALRAGGMLALEVDARRASLVAELVAADGRYCDLSVQLDLAGRERFVLATRLDMEQG